MINTKVRVVNDYGEDVAHNGIEKGEIIVKGDGVTNSEEESNRSIVNGWLYTGDIGTIDEQGRINVVNHKEDNLRGKIQTADIESVFYAHPAVNEVAVIITPDKELGETSHAVVVPHNDFKVTEQDLLNFALEKLSPSSCPSTVTFVDELPKTVSGKILKVQLREMVYK